MSETFPVPTIDEVEHLLGEVHALDGVVYQKTDRPTVNLPLPTDYRQLEHEYRSDDAALEAARAREST